MDMQQAREEFQARVEREREKAVRKYGEAGQAPGGDPSRDVLDYAINELVGLVRYAEMIRARVAAHRFRLRYAPRLHLLMDGLRRHARQDGEGLISLRAELLDLGVDLGAPEREPETLEPHA